jgi:hypothetical protein
MLFVIATLLILWLLGFSFHFGGDLIHALLAIVILLAIIHFLT